MDTKEAKGRWPHPATVLRAKHWLGSVDTKPSHPATALQAKPRHDALARQSPVRTPPSRPGATRSHPAIQRMLAMEIEPNPIKEGPTERQFSKVVWWAMCHMCTLVKDAGKLGVQQQSSTTANDMALHYTLQYTNNHHHDCVAVSLDENQGRVIVASNSGEMTVLSAEVLDYYRQTYPTHRRVDPKRLEELNNQINTELGLEKPKTHAEMQLVELGYLDNGETLGIERLCCLSCAAQLIVLGRQDEFTGSHGLFFDDAPVIPRIYKDPALLKKLIGPRAYGYVVKFEQAAQQEFMQAICRPIKCGVRVQDVLAACNVQRVVETIRTDNWRRNQQGKGAKLPSDG